MVEGLVAAANIDAEAHGAGDVDLRGSDGLDKGDTTCQLCGHRGGHRAAGTMGVSALQPGTGQFVHVPRVTDHVDEGLAVEMSSLDQSGCRAEIHEAASRVTHVSHAADRTAGQHFGLGNVGGDDPGQRQHVTEDGLHGIVIEEDVATLGHHDRVNDDLRQLMSAEGRSHGLDEFGSGEHAGLDGIATNVGDNRINLGRDDFGGHEMHCGDGHRVLGGQCRDGGSAIHAPGRKGLEIGLNARAAAGI